MPDIRILIAAQKAFYSSIGSIYCPILKETVDFTSAGFYHLLNESSSRPGNAIPRIISEQYLKLMCLNDATLVIQNCITAPDIRTVTKRLRGKRKKITYYALVHKGNSGRMMRVVVERIGNGKCTFLSVMPNASRRKIKKRPKGRS